MSRPLRIEFPGAVYHVTSRGDRREPIYRDDVDRAQQLDVLAQATERFDVEVLAWCQMGNHYHLVLHTREPNLSSFMRHLNGVYTQAFNRRHGLVGHLFQGRFKAILVDRDAYLLALCRYVERNPLAAKLVRAPADWPWSSCRAHLGLASTPPWLDTDGLHGYLIGRTVASARDRQLAVAHYRELVNDSQTGDAQFWQDALRGQIYLGDEDFVRRMQARAEPQRLAARGTPQSQRRKPLSRSWGEFLTACDGDRPRALQMAYRSGGVTMTELARQSGLSLSHVSRLIARAENEGKGET
jgi:putative transposase